MLAFLCWSVAVCCVHVLWCVVLCVTTATVASNATLTLRQYHPLSLTCLSCQRENYESDYKLSGNYQSFMLC